MPPVLCSPTSPSAAADRLAKVRVGLHSASADTDDAAARKAQGVRDEPAMPTYCVDDDVELNGLQS